MLHSLEVRLTTSMPRQTHYVAAVLCLLLLIVVGCRPSTNDSSSDGKPANKTSNSQSSSPSSKSADLSSLPDSKPQPAEPAVSQTPNTTAADSNSGATSSATESFPGAKLVNSKPPFLAAILVDHADQIYHEGDKLSVRFQAEQDAHLYLLYHQADGSTVLLFPNEANRDGRVAAKTPVTIPPADNSFRFRVSPPFGTEHLQVIASTKPLADLDGLIQKAGRAPAISSELLTKIGESLNQDLSTWTEHHVRITTQPKDGTEPKAKDNP